MKFTVDLAGALRKTATLAKVPQAARKQLERWGAQTVEALMRSAASLQKSGGKKKGGGMLARAVKMKTGADSITIGTNLDHPGPSSKYADIQDRGGTIRPKGHPYLAIPAKGIQDRPQDHPDAFVIETKKGNVLLVERVWSGAGAKSGGGYSWSKVRKGGWRGSGYKPGIRILFILKTEVTLPPTYWFRNPWQRMESILPGFMDEKVLYAEAEKMAGVAGGPR